MMMAAIAITKTKPAEATKKQIVRRLPAPVTGGVRTPCTLGPKLCDTGLSTDDEEQEEKRLILHLKEDIAVIWKENLVLSNKLKAMHEDEKRVKSEEERKIKSMNDQMEDFISQIPMGKLVKDATSQTDEFESINDKIAKVKKEALQREKKLWKDKEELLGKILMLQKKPTQSKKKAQNQVMQKFWGHSTITWTSGSGRQLCPDAPAEPKTSQRKKIKPKPKPYSIPFQPKPLNLFVKKSFEKPPPKLPPVYSTRSTTSALTVVSQPVACNSVNLDEGPAAALNDVYDDIIARELFADALERAIASNNIVHYNEDWNNNEAYEETIDDRQFAEEPDDIIALENFDHEANNQAEPFADPGATNGSEDDTCVSNTEWASHPYYDTPEEDDDADHLDYHDGPADDELINDDDDDATTNDEDDDTLASDGDDAAPASDEDEEDYEEWADSPYY